MMMIVNTMGTTRTPSLAVFLIVSFVDTFTDTFTGTFMGTFSEVATTANLAGVLGFINLVFV